ncbi:hypothetical protein [Streptomyces sp. NBC_00989]|uniref:hypothetical protein n=1 Tax=Streptomyces sp. NBC_00989 TaxID=2903705 RepID=UPI0038666447|nr:hypothetical protein OG714_54755 [Streptomyces sp. NBC_00989]
MDQSHDQASVDELVGGVGESVHGGLLDVAGEYGVQRRGRGRRPVVTVGALRDQSEWRLRGAGEISLDQQCSRRNDPAHARSGHHGVDLDLVVRGQLPQFRTAVRVRDVFFTVSQSHERFGPCCVRARPRTRNWSESCGRAESEGRFV